MKAGLLVLMMLVVVAGTMAAMAGPSSPNDFAASALRQDLTGQGTYHRQGLLREQNRALAVRNRVRVTSNARQAPWIAKVWNSIFPRKSSRSTQP